MPGAIREASRTKYIGNKYATKHVSRLSTADFCITFTPTARHGHPAPAPLGQYMRVDYNSNKETTMNPIAWPLASDRTSGLVQRTPLCARIPAMRTLVLAPPVRAPRGAECVPISLQLDVAKRAAILTARITGTGLDEMRGIV
jgi:hypothetical protein